jgi:16S rRNA (guanine527-N7)-methyltransferase
MNDATRQRLSAFVDLFHKWNRSINLSAASTKAEIAEHVDDCVHVIRHLQGLGRVLDVGSGGGLPAVVIAICLPDVQLTALEPVHKKHAFLRTAARELSLPNLDARAERLEQHEARDYDAATSRATFDLAEWLQRARPYVSATGIVLGFEAVERVDLPATIERDVYEIAGKRRAIVIDRAPSQ